MKLRNVLVFVFILALAGCAKPMTTEVERPGGEYIFVFADDVKPFNIAYSALSREVDRSAIKEINGPVRGFYGKHEAWGQGQSTYFVRVFAANGVDAAGNRVYGYYAEVTVEGDKGTEATAADKVFRDVEYIFAREGRKVPVRNLERAKYRSADMGDYMAGSGYNFGSRPAAAAAPAAPIAPERPLADPALAAPASDTPAYQVPASQSQPVEPVTQPEPAPAAQERPAPRLTSGMADEIEKLDDLRRRGILSDQEFQRAKERVLGL